jgi:hypothetical protein
MNETTVVKRKAGRVPIGLGRRLVFQFPPPVVTWIEQEAVRKNQTLKAVVLASIRHTMLSGGQP